MSHARLAAVSAAAVVAWLAWGRHVLSPWWFAVPAAAFLSLAFAHGRVVASRLRAERAAAFYDQGLARLENRWAGSGDAGERFLDQAHLYAGDLDVFGRGSLFELLCTARTRAGEETLAAWLTAPASLRDVRARQDAVRDVLPRLDLREDLARLATEVRDRVHAGSLSAWATAEPVLRSRFTPACCCGARSAPTPSSRGARRRGRRCRAGWRCGEFEALSALAGYAWENPEDPFPDVVDEAGGPRFEADALGHPLIPRESCVRNDVRLGGEHPQALVISGSNMSGKSTLLRTVGVNTVLALAGAPVRAGRLRLTPLSVGATLRIQDSLQTGTSRFYAEITRLRAIVDLTGGRPPLLFLLDEMLNGTNSRDRRTGAEAVLGWLVGHGAIGLVTTHDLALSQIADTLAPRAANVHFEDHLEDGRIRFDYVCRPGIMTRSNALELMRAVGLDVGSGSGAGPTGPISGRN
jgi:hypothetical protein